MKIAIFSDSYYPMVNGVVTSMMDLAKGMADKGHKVFIVAPVADKDYKEEEYPNITVLRVPAVNASFYDGFKWSSVLHKPTYDILRKAKIDLVHFMTPFTVSLFGILTAKLLKLPLIGTYHTFISDLKYIRQFFPYAGARMQKFAWSYSNAFYNRTNLITTPSEFTTRELIKNGCKSECITVSNGIKLDNFDNSKADGVKKKYNPDGHLILYVGRVSLEKNMLVLIKAFRELAKKDKTSKFLIVGDGPYMEESKKFVTDNNLEDRVEFLGMVPNVELRKSGLFKASRLFVTASTTENQPITILEAKANGLPCVGPKSMGMPWVIEDGESGFVVEPNSSQELADAMYKILSDDDIYRKFSNNAYESVQSHELSLIINEWEERYKNMISNFVPKRRRQKITA